jgi:transposase-like protein
VNEPSTPALLHIDPEGTRSQRKDEPPIELPASRQNGAREMSVIAKSYFYDEAEAFKHVEGLLWADGRVCPHCETINASSPLRGLHTKPSRKNPNGVPCHGLYKCRACRKQFTVRIGTIFEESHVPLHLWLQAIQLLSSSEAITAYRLQCILEVTHKTAWHLLRRIREALSAAAPIPITRAAPSDDIGTHAFGTPDHDDAGGLTLVVNHESQAERFREVANSLGANTSEDELDRNILRVSRGAPETRWPNRRFGEHQSTAVANA